MATTNINCLGTITVKGSATPAVQLLASEQTNNLQQSIVRVNVDSSANTVDIFLPSIDSYNNNWGILQIIVTDFAGAASINKITIFAWTDGIDTDGIEGDSTYRLGRDRESVTLTVAYGRELTGKAQWDIH